MIRGLGNRRLCACAWCVAWCMSMVRGFASHQELGSLISGGGCDVQRSLRLELSDAGSRFRVGDMNGRIRASTGKFTFKMVTVSLIWSVRMVHSVAASGHAALRDQPW